MLIIVKSVSFGVQRELYERLLVSTVTYGVGTWCMRMGEKRKLDIEGKMCSWRMCRMTRMNRWRNEEVKNRVDVREKMIDTVDQKVLK